MEDIVQEVLLRLPAKSLVRCKSLSKYWQNFITYNPSFHKSYLSRHGDKPSNSSFMVGFFFTKVRPFPACTVRFLPTSIEGETSLVKKRNRDDHDDSGHNASALSTPAASLPLRVDDESLGFLGCPMDMLNLLGSSSGFLLCSLEREKPMSYVICDPISKKVVALPKPNITEGFLTHGFICTTAYSRLHYYKVVRAVCNPIVYSSNMTLEILSSDSPDEWKLFNLTSPIAFFLYRSFKSIIVSEQGVVYFWAVISQEPFTYRMILVFDQTRSTYEMQLVEPPPRSEQPKKRQCFGLSDGHILYTIYELDQTTVWVLNDKPDSKEWSLKYKASLDTTMENYSELVGKLYDEQNFYIAAFHPTKPHVLFLGKKPKVFVHDLENSRLDLVYDTCALGWSLGYQSFPYTYGLIGPHLLLDD